VETTNFKNAVNVNIKINAATYDSGKMHDPSAPANWSFAKLAK
jgi:hypothetical protein